MRIMYFHNSIPDYRKELFLKLAKQEYQLRFVFTIFDYNATVYNTDVDVKYLERLNYTILPNGISAIKKTVMEVKAYKPDIIVLPALDTFREFSIAWSAISAAEENTRFIYFWEKWEAPKSLQPIKKRIKNGLQRMAFRTIIHKVSLYLSPGKKTDKYFMDSGVKPSRIFRFRDVSDVNVIEVDDLRKKYSIGDKRIFLYYGRIVKRKGLDLLIKGISRSKYRNNIYLIVAGDGDFRPFCEKLAESLLGDNYLFAGYVNPDNKYQYFSQSDIFVLPSSIENGTVEAWGLTVNEALLTGNYVICSDIVGSAYEIVNSENGLIFEHNNLDELVCCIDKAFEVEKGEKFQQSIGSFSNNYTFENMACDFNNAFFKVFEECGISFKKKREEQK